MILNARTSCRGVKRECLRTVFIELLRPVRRDSSCLSFREVIVLIVQVDGEEIVHIFFHSCLSLVNSG